MNKFIKDNIYYLPKLGCKIKFIKKANTTYSIDFFDFKIVEDSLLGKRVLSWNKIVRVLKSEVQPLKDQEAA